MSDEQILADISLLMRDWRPPAPEFHSVRIEKTGAGWLIVGRYAERVHGGCRDDGVSLAHDLNRIAREEAGEMPVAFVDGHGDVHAAQEEDDEPFTEFTEEEFAPVAEEGEAEAPPDHGGVLIQFDDLGKLRNDVIAAITFQEIVRARPLENDTNRWDELRDLRGLAADAGKSMDPMTEAQWDRLNELERTFHGRLNEIKRHASQLRDRAFDASPEMLAAMAADIWNGGP